MVDESQRKYGEPFEMPDGPAIWKEQERRVNGHDPPQAQRQMASVYTPADQA